MKPFLPILVGLAFLVGTTVAGGPPLSPEEKLLQEMFGHDEGPSPVPSTDPRLVEAECRRVLGSLRNGIQGYITENFAEFMAMKQRVMASGVSEEEFYRWITKLVHTFQNFEHRIRLARFVDGEHASQQFLRGITLWVDSERQLEQAIEIFYRQSESDERRINKANQVTNLEYFAARMAWLVFVYDIKEPGNRRKALRDLAKFDETNALEHRVHLRHETMEIINDAADVSSYRLTLKPLGIRYVENPVTSQNLVINNGRRLSTYGITGPDLWAIKNIAEDQQDELVLGIGDESVRQFFRLIRVVNGSYVHRFPFCADFLTIRNAGGKWKFVVRELKFSRRSTPVVDIPKALEQLQSTVDGLFDLYGDEIPIDQLEIIVPQRDLAFNGELGKGYVSSVPLPGSKKTTIHRLFRRLPESTQKLEVTISYNGKTLPVRLREIPITDERYEELRLDLESSELDELDKLIP